MAWDPTTNILVCTLHRGALLVYVHNTEQSQWFVVEEKRQMSFRHTYFNPQQLLIISVFIYMVNKATTTQGGIELGWLNISSCSTDQPYLEWVDICTKRKVSLYLKSYICFGLRDTTLNIVTGFHKINV